jgi:nitrate reductase gamma subunit
MALGLLIFILFPFTRLVHMLSVPVRYLWRPGYQIVRSRATGERPAGQVGPGTNSAHPQSTPAE